MGCDIHPYVETRESAAGPWSAVLAECDHCDGLGYDKYEDKVCTRCLLPEEDHPDDKKCLFDHTNAVEFQHPDCPQCHGTKLSPERGHSDRNYWLFNRLAGVRGGPDTAIEQPKGIPDDASDAYKAVVARWGGDGHSHSYFVLSELLAVEWSSREETLDDFRTKKKVSVKAYEGWKEWLDELAAKYPNPDNVRIVFFFDN